jgi:hypothetical protein
MSREGAMLAARDRARRLQASLGDGATPVLMGCTLVVLLEAPRATLAPAPAAAANAPLAATVTAKAAADRTR